MTKKTIYMASFLIALSGVFIFGAVSYGDNEKIIAAGEAGIEDYFLETTKDVAADRVINFKITERSGNYFWGHNGNKPLKRIEKKLIGKDGYIVAYSLFLNLDGEGTIIIRHDASSADSDTSCHFMAHNYREYRLNSNGQLVPYIGVTKPAYPFPKPHDLKKCRTH